MAPPPRPPRAPPLRVVALLVLAAAAAQLRPAAANRLLKAAPLNCSSIHPSCSSCSLSRAPGLSGLTTSALVCRSCRSPAYQLASDANTCGCAPGFFGQPAPSTTCEPCAKNSWCAGGVGASAQSTPCGACLMTATTSAQNASACITQPGCGWNPDATAAPCSIGTYSTGSNQQPCAPCPAGLTTVSTFSRSVSECLAPPGYFYQNNQALPCPKGTYKTGIDKAPSCLPCPTGLTTAGPTSAAPAACSLAAPGYWPTTDASGNLTVGACPIGTYGPDGTQCLSCPDALTTRREASPSPADCLAPPGFGYYADGAGDNSPITSADLAGSKVVACPQGSFKVGWNLARCTSCGVNLLTDTSASNGLGVSADQCYVPPGWGTVVDSKLQRLVAVKCNNGSYGLPQRVYGQQHHPCQPCPAYTATPDQHPEAGAIEVVISVEQCTTLPGYGWEDGTAAPCPIGYFARGNQACIKCGQGLSTQNTTSARVEDCVPLPGWQRKSPTDQFAVPCEVGAYSEGGADSACRKCPLGSSTQYTQSYAASQCSVCAPGWGFDAHASQCAICAPGSFSPGGSDEACTPCGPGQTSTLGAASSSDCLDEFVVPAPYDVIPLPPSAWIAVDSPSTPDMSAVVAACKDACKADARCQLFAFRARQADPSQNGCFLKLATLLPAPDTYASFKLGTGDYSIWQASADEFGVLAAGALPWAAPDGAAADPWRCLRGCDKDASCRAVFVTRPNGTWACWQVEGAFSLGVSAGGVKATAINNYFWGWATGPADADPEAPPAATSPAPSSPAVTAIPPSPEPQPPQPSPEPQQPAPQVDAIGSPGGSPLPSADNQQAGLLAINDGANLPAAPPSLNPSPPPVTSPSSPLPASSPPPLEAPGAGSPALNTTVRASEYRVITAAGYGNQASDGDGAPARSAGLFFPYGVSVDASDNVYICDTHNHRVRMVNATTGIITTVAGSGVAGFGGDGGLATAAAFNLPTSVAFDASNNMYITDTGNNRVRAVDAVTGVVRTVVGNGDGGFGGAGGPAAGVLLNVPVHIAFDAASNMYVTCFAARRVLRIDAHSGNMTVAAGVGTPGFSGDGGPAAEAELNNPASVAFEATTGAMFIADSLNQRVRRVDPASGVITTYAGSRQYGFDGDGGPANAARLCSPMAITFDRAGNLLVSDTYNQRVRRVVAATGRIETIAGSGVAGYGGDNGPAAEAELSTPEGLAVDSTGAVYVADYASHRVRKLLPDTQR